MNNNINSFMDSIKMMFLMNIKNTNFTENLLMIILISFLTFLINNDTCYLKLEEIGKNILDSLSFLKQKEILLF